MKKICIILMLLSAAIVWSCRSHKSNSSSAVHTTPPAVATTSTPTPSSPLPAPKPSNGVYVPGTEELLAVRTKYTLYKDVSLEQLKEGYEIYTKGACVNCHRAKDIYVYAEGQWYEIIQDMALRARMTDEQKNTVYKYVLAIKASQPKGAR